jgi:hypothetical protein
MDGVPCVGMRYNGNLVWGITGTTALEEGQEPLLLAWFTGDNGMRSIGMRSMPYKKISFAFTDQL